VHEGRSKDPLARLYERPDFDAAVGLEDRTAFGDHDGFVHVFGFDNLVRLSRRKDFVQGRTTLPLQSSGPPN
jgi:hypothetical protein